jgi:hypothetical protein
MENGTQSIHGFLTRVFLREVGNIEARDFRKNEEKKS